MAEGGRAPRIGCVARPAFGRCLQVRCRLTRRLGAIVATGACADHIIMIDSLDGGPSAGRVTILARRVGGNMGRGFAGCTCAIVAGRTGPANIGMAEIRRRPGRCRMAGAAFR